MYKVTLSCTKLLSGVIKADACTDNVQVNSNSYSLCKHILMLDDGKLVD